MKTASSAPGDFGGLEFEYFNHGHEERYQNQNQIADADWRGLAGIVGKELILL